MNYLISVLLILGLVNCHYKSSDSQTKSIETNDSTLKTKTIETKLISLKRNIIDSIFLVIPNTDGKYEDDNYSNIELYQSNMLIFKDTTLTQYMIDKDFWPFARKVGRDKYEILIRVFDAPNNNKIYGFYINKNALTKIITFPDFSKDLKQKGISSGSILSGILDITEAPCNNCDSAFYNPTLYYRLGKNGVYLDSALTIKENTKHWKGFYGFYLTEEIVLLRPK